MGAGVATPHPEEAPARSNTPEVPVAKGAAVGVRAPRPEQAVRPQPVLLLPVGVEAARPAETEGPPPVVPQVLEAAVATNHRPPALRRARASLAERRWI
jgi:hypothetical protein